MTDALAVYMGTVIGEFFGIWFVFYMVRWFGIWMMETWLS